MPVVANDFVLRLSGGSANADANASLGGAKSSVSASTAVDGLFDTVSPAEATAGDVEYRCVYLHNANASSTMLATVAWISANTPSPSTDLAIGLGTSAVNGTEQTVANENTAPAGVTFGAAASQGAGLAVGSLAPGEHRALWLRRTVSAGAAATANDTWSLGFYCEFTS